MNKRALVLGAGGFIGNHMVDRLKTEGFYVLGIDLKFPEYTAESKADVFLIRDLRDKRAIEEVLIHEFFDEVYQFAADMGGAGFVFTGENDAEILHNSSLINLNLLKSISLTNLRPKVFYSSSACMYPEHNQNDPANPLCEEESAYPANPDSEYGWEKLFSERLYAAFSRNFGIPIAIARYHNIYGPLGTWKDGREKAPAAICRKVALAEDQSSIEIWGDGKQTRSFLFIAECIEATRRLMNSDYSRPINIGSEEMVTIDQLVDLTCQIAGKSLTKRYNLDRPMGVRGRNSDNNLIRKVLGWDYSMPLSKGIAETYAWINHQISLEK
jgi:GDP-D-mannose 3',5'-epimerase